MIWVSFFANALLVLLQLGKPELDDVAPVYDLTGDRAGVPVSGWQAFWTGGDAIDFAHGGRGHIDDYNSRRCLCCAGDLSQWLDCCRGRRGEERNENGELESGAWPIGSGEPGTLGTLNDSLLGTISLGESRTRGVGGTLLWSKNKRVKMGAGRRYGCFRRTRGFVSSLVGGDIPGSEDGREELLRQDSVSGYRPIVSGSAIAVRAPAMLRTRTARDRSSSSAYSISSRARPPPQAAAPVFGISVTRWRVVNANGVPFAHCLPTDTWTDQSTDRSFDGSSRTATTFSDSESATAGAASVSSGATAGEADGITSTTPLRVQFEFAVRASGQGEMDWWGRGIGTHSPGSGAAAASATGDWRLWRSAEDVLALYDALALRFGQEFCGRVSRPQLKTARLPSPEAAGGDEALPTSGSPKRVSPHRLDIARDARKIGAFLRSLLGLRQFLR